MTDAATDVLDNPAAGADDDDNQSLLSVRPAEDETAQSDEPSHLVSDDLDAAPADPAPAVADRPDNIPSQFWNTKAGTVEVDKLAKAYSDLRAKMDSGKHKAPKDGKYDFSSVAEIPEGDDALAGFVDIAREEGISQAAAERLVRFYLDQQGALDEEIKYRRSEEMQKLGRNADKIIASTESWLTKMQSSGVINANELNALAGASNNALVVTALNKIRRSYNERDVPSITAVEPAAVDMDTIHSMMADPKYGRDMAYTRKVENMVYEMHGERR